MSSVRVRFAPSPTGNVHIGNIRVAIFNWLYARHTGGKFLLRIEDTDLERSTPEAIANLFKALEWLRLDYDEEPVYQTRQLPRHQAAVARLLRNGHARQAGPGQPVILNLHAGLFDASFVTEPREVTEIEVNKGALLAGPRGLIYQTVSSKSGETFTTEYNWDALDSLEILGEGGEAVAGTALREKLSGAGAEAAVAACLGWAPAKLRFRRRFVFFDDLVLGRLEKPLDSLRDQVIVRSDGSPVFHLANVVDDIDQQVTDILRGNDHVENTFRHLFLFRALGAVPPRYGHFPMIVNAKGKPYSKRDGDAYVGDFRAKGYLADCLFNFLALCGWSPGDGREIMARGEMVESFGVERVNDAPAQFNLEKLEWMNGQYFNRLPVEELAPLVHAELEREGVDAGAIEPQWLARLVELERERLRTLRDFVENTRFFFVETVTFDPKAVKKVLLKNDGAGLKALGEMQPILTELGEWNEAALESAIQAYANERGLGLGDVAQPLRVAMTGTAVSRGIWESLALVGRERMLKRVAAALEAGRSAAVS